MVGVITLCKILTGQHIYLTTVAFVVILLINKPNILGIQNNVLEHVTNNVMFKQPCPDGWFFIQDSEKCYYVMRRDHLRRDQKRACSNDGVLPKALKSDLSIIKDAHNFGEICDKIRDLGIRNTYLHTDIFRDDRDVWRWIRTNEEVDPLVLSLIINDHKRQKWKYAYFHVKSQSCQMEAKETEESLLGFGLCEIWNVNNCTYDNGGCKEEEEHRRCVKVTPGVSVCKCRTGFILTIDGVCADVDECATFNAGCVKDTCTNTLGSFTCRKICGRGFVQENDSCVDINECEEGRDDCTYSFKCVNNQGGFSCVERVLYSWIFFVIFWAILIVLAFCLVLNKYQRRRIRLEQLRRERISSRNSLRDSSRTRSYTVQCFRHCPTQMGFSYEDIYDKDTEVLSPRVKSSAVDLVGSGSRCHIQTGMDGLKQSLCRSETNVMEGRKSTAV